MLEAIHQLGKYYIEKNHLVLNNEDDLLKILVEDPDSTGNYKHVLVINFDKNYKFINVTYEEFKKYDENGNLDLTKYLYRSGSSRGTNFTPSTRVSEKITGTLNSRILKWFCNPSEKNKNKVKGQKICLNKNFGSLYEQLKLNEKNISSKLEEYLKSFGKNESVFLTVKIDNKYLGSIDEFRKEFIKDYLISIKNKHEKDSYSENSQCFLCNRQKEVYGFTVSYAFYSFNNQGFITGGNFNQKDAYKNLPICLECALSMEAGKKVIENEITPQDKNYFQMPGLRYLLIPKFIDNSFDKIDDTIEYFKEYFKDSNTDFINAPQQQINQEKDIIDILKEVQNYASFNILIFKEKNAEYKILLSIEDVFPSRLNELAKAKQDIESNKYFKSIKRGKDKYINLIMSFRLIYNLFRVYKTSKKEKGIDERPKLKERNYLEIINSIFINKKINYENLLEEIMDKVSLAFINKRSYEKTALEAFMFLNYLKKLDLLDNFYEDKTMETPISKINENEKIEKIELREKITSLFNEFPEFYKCDARKVSFLTGVLIKKLLNNQLQMNETQPFRKELNRLKLNESLIKEIFRKAIEKLESYKRNYYKDLEEIIIDYYQKAGEDWQISNKDISFFFVAGMTKANEIIPPKKNYEKETIEEVSEETDEESENE